MLHASSLPAILLALLACAVSSADVLPLSFGVKLDVIRRELHRDWCWFHPRAAAAPPGTPTVVLTLQRHLVTSDYYSGLYFMRSDDCGATWTEPVLPPQLDWRTSGEETIAVCDVTPGWHAPTRTVVAIGTRLRYDVAGQQLLDQPGSHQVSYAVYDPVGGQWQGWREVALPDMGTEFHLAVAGCVQWLVKEDGSLLLPIYFKGKDGEDYSVTVLHCTYDGQTIKYLSHGDELTVTGGRGLCEPSLALYRGRYYLTLRNDARAYVTVGEDGLHWAPTRAWTFDDGSELGSYNTQAHWLTHSGGLFLAYTRRGADNDHIMRNRAPLFLAQVDPERLQVLRSMEQVLIPERGVMLGNFGACTISAGESWVTDAEYIHGDQPDPRGADGSVFAARVQWSEANRLVGERR